MIVRVFKIEPLEKELMARSLYINTIMPVCGNHMSTAAYRRPCLCLIYQSPLTVILMDVEQAQGTR